MSRTSKIKIFVLDTNVLLHSSASIGSFHDNDVVIPMAVVEELDKFKKIRMNSAAMPAGSSVCLTGSKVKTFSAMLPCSAVNAVIWRHWLQKNYNLR
jgi:hypothetical protein